MNEERKWKLIRTGGAVELRLCNGTDKSPWRECKVKLASESQHALALAVDEDFATGTGGMLISPEDRAKILLLSLDRRSGFYVDLFSGLVYEVNAL